MDNKLYKKISKYIKENLLYILILITIFVVLNVKLPWSIYTPGGLINIDDRLKGSKYESEGTFNLTYVTSMEGKIPSLLLALILPEWDIISNENVKIDNETLKDAINRERIYLKESISNATLVAYEHANKDIKIKSESDYINYIYEEADTDLSAGDKILKINNIPINNYEDITKIINSCDYNDKISIKVSRNDKEIDCYARINNINDEKKIGIAISKINEYSTSPKITYQEKASESGSSGGLMLALAIYDSLVEEDITKGLTISGTGTIDILGNVGPIGGVKYKLAGAVKNKSEIFIVPADNYDEAIKLKKENNYSISIIKAENFEQVLEEIANYSK